MKRLIIEVSEAQVLAILPQVMGQFTRIMIEDVAPLQLSEPAPALLSAPEEKPPVRDAIPAQPKKAKERQPRGGYIAPRTRNGKTTEDVILETIPEDGSFILRAKVTQALRQAGFSGNLDPLHRLEQKGLVEARTDARNITSVRRMPRNAE